MAKIIMLGDHLPSNKRILSGRDVGEDARKRYHLDELDKQDEQIEVVIPDKIWTLGASYFLGCFGKSVRTLGEDKFRGKYTFKCNKIFLPNIEDGIYRAMHTSGGLDSGSGV